MNTIDFFELITTCEDLDSFIDACGKHFGNPLWIMDNAYHLLAYSHTPDSYVYIEDFTSGKTMGHIKEWLESGLFQKVTGNHGPVYIHDDSFDKDMVVLNVIFQDRIVGKLSIVLDHPMDVKNTLNIAQGASIYLRSYLTTTNNTLEQALILLLQNDDDSEAIAHRILSEELYHKQATYQIVCVETKEKHRFEIYSAFISDLRRECPYILSTLFRNRCFLLVPVNSHIPKHLCTADMRFGYSLPFDQLHVVANYADQAEFALQTGSEQIEKFEDHYLNFAKAALHAQIKNEEAYIMPEIRRMIDYDEKYHTEYYKTFVTYLSNAESKHRTSEILGVHLNTVKYRLSQMTELFSIDPTKGKLYCLSILLAGYL